MDLEAGDELLTVIARAVWAAAPAGATLHGVYSDSEAFTSYLLDPAGAPLVAEPDIGMYAAVEDLHDAMTTADGTRWSGITMSVSPDGAAHSEFDWSPPQSDEDVMASVNATP